MDGNSIPVIDISALRNRDAAGTLKIAGLLDKACREMGFFYISNHGIPDKVIADVFASADRFYALPLEEKMQLSMEQYSDCFRGYAPVLSELADGMRNSYELMEFSVEFNEGHPDVLAKKPMHGPNLWPGLPGYKEAITCYVDHMIELGFDLMRAMAIALKVDENFFYEAFHGRSFWQFRTTHYPEANAVDGMAEKLLQTGRIAEIDIGDYNCGAHTDYGCLTILLANNPGLQVLNRNGEWFDAPALPGTYICNIGDMLQYWTRDLYLATMHRVVTDQSRVSLPFFFQPDYETLVLPVGRKVKETDKQFPPIKYGPYAFEKYKGIYPNCQFN